MTQPQGHSTSGSHERYKTPERLKFEQEFDCLTRMRTWMMETGAASEHELEGMEQADRNTVEDIRKAAWEAYLSPILEERGQVVDMLEEIAGSSSHAPALRLIGERLASLPSLTRRDIHIAAHEALRLLRDEAHPSKQVLVHWKKSQDEVNEQRFGSHLYTGSALQVEEIKPAYSESSPTVMGFEVMNAAFDHSWNATRA